MNLKSFKRLFAFVYLLLSQKPWIAFCKFIDSFCFAFFEFRQVIFASLVHYGKCFVF